jgi:hypothetical protein
MHYAAEVKNIILKFKKNRNIGNRSGICSVPTQILHKSGVLTICRQYPAERHPKSVRSQASIKWTNILKGKQGRIFVLNKFWVADMVHFRESVSRFQSSNSERSDLLFEPGKPVLVKKDMGFFIMDRCREICIPFYNWILRCMALSSPSQKLGSRNRKRG